MLTDTPQINPITLNITEIPFYKAVAHFENNTFALALPLFITCAMHGNIYACHYIQHILSLPTNKPYDLTPEQAHFIDPNVFTPFFNELPKEFMPDSWLKTSRMKTSDWLNRPLQAKKQTFIELNDLALWNGNAFHYLHDIIAKEPALYQSMDKKFTLTCSIINMRIADLYSVLKNTIDPGVLLLENSEKKGDQKLVIFVNQEIGLCHRFAILGKHHGDLERMIITQLYNNNKNERRIKWQRSGALMGCSELQYILAKVGDKDIKNPIAWLIQAAKKNDPRMIIDAFTHFHKEKNLKKSSDLLKRVTPDHINNLLENKKIDKQTAGFIFFHLGYYTENQLGSFLYNFTNMLNYYIQSYKLSYANAHLAIESSLNKANTHDTKTAEAEAAKAEAHEHLAHLYISGIHGVKQDLNRARLHFEKASTHGFILPDSSLHFADVLIQTDPTQWQTILKHCEAILTKDKNNHTAALIWGQCNLDSPAPDYKTAKNRLLLASKNFPQALHAIVQHALRNNHYADARQYAEQGYNQKNTETKSIYAISLGLLYENQHIPNLSEKESLKKAAKYYLEASDTPEGSSNYGSMLMKLGSMNENVTEAKKQFLEAEKALKRAIQKGCTLANFNLATLYNTHGLTMGYKPDPKKTFRYLQAAQSLPDPDIHHDLAFSYHTGSGCPKDIKKALEHYQLAASYGSPLACANLAGLFCSNNSEKEEISTETLKLCVELLDHCDQLMSKKNIFGSIGTIPYLHFIFIQGMMKLMLDPNELPRVLNQWVSALQSDQHSIYREELQTTIDFLNKKPPGILLPHAFFMSLLVDPNIVSKSLDDLEDLEDLEDIKNLEDQEDLKDQKEIENPKDLTVTNKTKTPPKTDPEPKKAIASHTSNPTHKLLERLYNFVNQPLKEASVKAFDKIMRSEAAKTNFGLIRSEAEGSRVKYVTNTGNTFGTHITHGRDKASLKQAQALREQAYYLIRQTESQAEPQETKRHTPRKNGHSAP